MEKAPTAWTVCAERDQMGSPRREPVKGGWVLAFGRLELGDFQR